MSQQDFGWAVAVAIVALYISYQAVQVDRCDMRGFGFPDGPHSPCLMIPCIKVVLGWQTASGGASQVHPRRFPRYGACQS